jgi:hypothetical protein
LLCFALLCFAVVLFFCTYVLCFKFWSFVIFVKSYECVLPRQSPMQYEFIAECK